MRASFLSRLRFGSAVNGGGDGSGHVRHAAGQACAGCVLQQVIERPTTPLALRDRLDKMRQSVAAVLLCEQADLILDPGGHLLLQCRACLEEDGRAQDQRRHREDNDIQRGKPEVGDAQQSGHNHASQGAPGVAARSM